MGVTGCVSGLMDTLAILFEKPEHLALSSVELVAPGPRDVVVDIRWSGISTGTERLLWTGKMPSFPGMGYPLVPGYESVGKVVDAGPEAATLLGRDVFVPGARCFTNALGLFGGASSRLVVSSDRVTPVSADLGADAVLLALAATAQHAIGLEPTRFPELIVGHGILGRLAARLIIAHGGTLPQVYETNPVRHRGAAGYAVLDPSTDRKKDYRHILDMSGDAAVLDSLIARLGKGGEITLAGFYHEPLSFTFPPAFMRETRIAIAAEWQPRDLAAVQRLIADGQLSLAGLITHTSAATDAREAYETAFGDPECLKMILDWGHLQ
jgi:bacteriochlorophyllide a dehydrogenase